MVKCTLIFEDGAVSISKSFSVDDDGGSRYISYGMRRFGTADPDEVVGRFAEVFMGNLTAETIADEQRIAAKDAAEAVPAINYKITNV
jgi:hypothetical protein